MLMTAEESKIDYRAGPRGGPRPGAGRPRADICSRGHDRTDPNNLYINPRTGYASCRACKRIRGREVRTERKRTEHATAVHEAGHVIIGRVLLGFWTDYVTIEPDADSGGHAIIPDHSAIVWRWEGDGPEIRGTQLWTTGLRPHGSYESALRGRAMTYLAGWAAEVELLGSCRGGGDYSDRCEVDLMLNKLSVPSDKHRRYVERLESRTRSLVRRHRLKIEQLAALLVKRRSMTEADLNASIEMPAPPLPRRIEISRDKVIVDDAAFEAAIAELLSRQKGRAAPDRGAGQI